MDDRASGAMKRWDAVCCDTTAAFLAAAITLLHLVTADGCSVFRDELHYLACDERRRVCIFAQNYGQAGAMDSFGPSLGLPRAIAGHSSYWL